VLIAAKLLPIGQSPAGIGKLRLALPSPLTRRATLEADEDPTEMTLVKETADGGDVGQAKSSD